MPSSCGITDSLERSSLKRVVDMSRLSIRIWPLVISTTPNSELANDDFPLPLRPQIPIWGWENVQNVGAQHDTTITHKPLRVNALIINDSLCYMLLHCLHIITLLTALSPDITAHGEKRPSQLRLSSAKSCLGETTAGFTIRESYGTSEHNLLLCYFGSVIVWLRKKNWKPPTFQFENYFKLYSTQLVVSQVINKWHDRGNVQ